MFTDDRKVPVPTSPASTGQHTGLTLTRACTHIGVGTHVDPFSGTRCLLTHHDGFSHPGFSPGSTHPPSIASEPRPKPSIARTHRRTMPRGHTQTERCHIVPAPSTNCRVRRATTMPNVSPFSCLSQTSLFSDTFGDDLGTLQTSPRAFSRSRESQAKMRSHTVAATDDATYVRTRTGKLLANVRALILFFTRAMLNAGRPAFFPRASPRAQATDDVTHTQTGQNTAASPSLVPSPPSHAHTGGHCHAGTHIRNDATSSASAPSPGSPPSGEFVLLASLSFLFTTTVSDSDMPQVPGNHP